MKAHRRLAKNCALIESCQVVAQKSGWGLSADATRASSKVGGGEGALGQIPQTVTDEEGKLGERKRSGLAPDPFSSQGARGRLPAGHSSNNSSALGNAPQREDMEAEVERLGFKGVAGIPSAAPAQPTIPAAPSSESVSPSTIPTTSRGGPTLPAAYTDRPAASMTPPPARDVPSGEARAPAAATPPPAPPETEPDEPKPHFQRGVKKPGVSRFISGSRRR